MKICYDFNIDLVKENHMAFSPNHPSSLEYKARDRGFASVEDMVAAALAQGGTVKAAADIIGCYHAALQKWLDRNGYYVEKTAVLRPAEGLQRAS